MKTIKATFSNGDSLITGINGSEDQIRAYYIGNRFNLGDGAEGDNLQTCISVEFIN
jgi:hypothetical protein